MARPSATSFDALLAKAHALADRSGAVILPHFRAGGAVDHKGGAAFDPVTAADRGAETALKAMIAESYPEHGILGEEHGADRADAEYCWIIDPIDGTRAFIIGQPLWGTLIGLTRNGTPMLGMMDQPFTRERFWGGQGGAFYRREGEPRKIRAKACADLSQALLGSSSPDLFETENERQAFDRLVRSVRLRRFGGDCYNYCLLALGQLDLIVEAGLKTYDIVPLIPIIEQAGGVVTTWDGGDPRDGGRILAAGDAKLHEAAMKLLAG